MITVSGWGHGQQAEVAETVYCACQRILGLKSQRLKLLLERELHLTVSLMLDHSSLFLYSKTVFFITSNICLQVDWSKQSTCCMSAFCNHHSILVYKHGEWLIKLIHLVTWTDVQCTWFPSVGKWELFGFLIHFHFFPFLLPDQSTHKRSKKLQDFLRCFLLKEIPPRCLLQVFGCGLSKPYLFHIRSKT